MILPRQRFHLLVLDSRTRLESFAEDVRAGLTGLPKALPCRYFYDDEGSRLFGEICTLPEYYLPRAEREVLHTHAADAAGEFAGPVTLVELGSGNAAKTRILIEQLLRRQGRLKYVPIDICRGVLEHSSRELLDDYPGLSVLGLAGEYHQALEHLSGIAEEPKLILWLGSNIGNFDRDEAAQFLQRVRQTMTPGDRLLAGIDLRKDPGTLERAYDDSRGVTARFNLNLLRRINRELGGRFDLAAFRHRAVYNEDAGRVEMYIDSVRGQCVRIEQLRLDVPFAAGEAVHTENSYKYSRDEIEAVAAAAGLELRRQWLDARGRFSTNLFATL
jgi:dimethylhistidine N-methyltransferase